MIYFEAQRQPHHISEGVDSMYYAQMYCYGTDNNHVGITGIRGCLGVAFATANRLYSVHIPPSNPQRDLAGAMAFVYMIIGMEGAPNPVGNLYLFVNGTNRTQVDDEARTMKTGLSGPPTRVYRMMTNLGPQSGGGSADAATMKVQRIAGNIDLSYKHVPDNDWVAGGNAKTGCYYPPMNGTFGGAVVPNGAALGAGWIQMGLATCSIRTIH
jgi:hypothetical protein